MTDKTDINALIEQLKEAAEKATPGPWFTDEQFTIDDGLGSNIATVHQRTPISVNPKQCDRKANTDFIAKANPEAITIIINALEAERHRAEHFQKTNNEYIEHNGKLSNGIKAAQQRITELTEKRQRHESRYPVFTMIRRYQPERDDKEEEPERPFLRHVFSEEENKKIKEIIHEVIADSIRPGGLLSKL